MRVSDTVARYEENEFALLLPETDHPGVLELCQRLLDALYAYPFPGRESFPDSRITVSMGSATFPKRGNTSGALVDHGIASSRPWCARRHVRAYSMPPMRRTCSIRCGAGPRAVSTRSSTPWGPAPCTRA